VETIAPDVHRIALLPRDGLNAYLLGDVLVDAGLARSGDTIIEALGGRTVSEHVATHAHLDHVGGSAKVVAGLGLDGVAIGAVDADAARAGRPVAKEGAMGRALARAGRFAAVDVTRELREGDEVGPGFYVLEAPGHTPGQIVLWRPSDRLLIAGDVLTNVFGLHEPPGMLNVDPDQNRRSVRKLAALEPATVAFGHGHVLRDPQELHSYAKTM
jgi:glyoxylase-like metal-dependent hydrolase (beta-lactamase superfamily II)